MELLFTKYHGTGNDFVMINGFDQEVNLSAEQVKRICHRRFGIGADGLIILQPHSELDFEMIYFNSDGRQSSMCGNGGRCIVHYAHQLGLVKKNVRFMAIDGIHDAMVREDGLIALRMNDVKVIENLGDAYVLDTGSPHYVTYVSSFPSDFVLQAGAIRNRDEFRKEGINVNFVVAKDDHLQVRTFERGVEDETYSCGTGVTAVACVHAMKNKSIGNHHTLLSTPGGDLQVSLSVQEGDSITDIMLIGPAKAVFDGSLTIG